jgi:hypothetical protein
MRNRDGFLGLRETDDRLISAHKYDQNASQLSLKEVDSMVPQMNALWGTHIGKHRETYMIFERYDDSDSRPSIAWTDSIMLAIFLTTLLTTPLCGWRCTRALVRDHRQRQRVRDIAAGRCPACAYDIRAAYECRCPECGETWFEAVVGSRVDQEDRATDAINQ